MKEDSDIIYISSNAKDMIIRLENGGYVLISNDLKISGTKSYDPFYLYSLLCTTMNRELKPREFYGQEI